MQPVYQTTTTVLPGHKIEITAPDIREGQQVRVVVIPTSPGPAEVKTGPSIFDIIASLKGHRLFKTSAEVDQYIHEERDSWER